MAVQTAVSKRGRRRSSIIVEEVPGLLASITDNSKNDGKIKLDLSLSTLLNGEWQKRRIACTKSRLCFMMPDDELIRDSIPLNEIIAVEVMRESNSISDRSEVHNQLRKINKEAFFRRGSNENVDMSIESKAAKQSSVGMNAFQIRTAPDGYNSGRIYYLQAESRESRDEVIEKLRKLISSAKIRFEGTSRFVQSQRAVRSVYESTAFQTLSSLLIIVNFGSSIAEAQMDNVSDAGSGHEDTFYKLDLFLTMAFTVELLINAYSNWLRPFVSNGWSMFDALIVSLSLISLVVDGMPVRLILLLRCCRVLRIFGKIPSVAKIFAALFQSLIPMMNAFFIIFIIAAIYSIVGVTFFSDDIPSYFGNFTLAFVAMFRITIGSLDWWFEEFPSVQGASSSNSTQLLFLISYVILVNWVFFQVSIAVLLDNFLSASEAMKAEEYKRNIKEKHVEKHFRNPLDPLILRLSKDYINDADLSARLDELFKVLDSDGSGDLSSQEFQAAMKKLDISPRIFVSDSDFIAITKNGTLCNACGHLGPKEFENVMREQIRLYTQQRLSSSSEFWAVSDDDFTELASMKQILNELLGTRAEQERTSRRLEEVISIFLDNKISVQSESNSYSNRSDGDCDCDRCSITSISNRIVVGTSRSEPNFQIQFAVNEQQRISSTNSTRIDEDRCSSEILAESEVLQSLPDLKCIVPDMSNPHGPADGGGLWSASRLGPPLSEDEVCWLDGNNANCMASGPSPFRVLEVDEHENMQASKPLSWKSNVAACTGADLMPWDEAPSMTLEAQTKHASAVSEEAANLMGFEIVEEPEVPSQILTCVAAMEPTVDLAPNSRRLENETDDSILHKEFFYSYKTIEGNGRRSSRWHQVHQQT